MRCEILMRMSLEVIPLQMIVDVQSIEENQSEKSLRDSSQPDSSNSYSLNSIA